MTSPLGNDLVPDYPTREVLGCPRLLRWDLMTPIQWISKPGESMDALVERSGLGNFWPIKDQEVKNMVKDFLEAPKRDQWVEFQLNSTTTLLVRIHSTPRKRIYDFDDGTLDRAWIYGRLHLTMAYMSDGHFQVISGYRMGNSSLYLDEKWTGATFFIKALRT